MGGVASGVGHAASGFGSIASHAASEVGRVAGPALRAASEGASKAAPVLANAGATALKASEIAVEVLAASGENSSSDDTVGEDTDDGSTPSLDRSAPAGDLCLDCPDAGNCASCPQPRYVP